jgi:hypothetical protein
VSDAHLNLLHLNINPTSEPVQSKELCSDLVWPNCLMPTEQQQWQASPHE